MITPTSMVYYLNEFYFYHQHSIVMLVIYFLDCPEFCNLPDATPKKSQTDFSGLYLCKTIAYNYRMIFNIENLMPTVERK